MKESAINKSQSPFDFLFVGLGAANCLLILRLNEHGFLKGKTVAIVEPDTKSTNERISCFWTMQDELARTQLKRLIGNSCDSIEIIRKNKQQKRELQHFHKKVIDVYNEKNNQLSSRKTARQKIVFYDRLQLKRSDEKHEYGKRIFDALFKKVAVTGVLSFLREKTNNSEPSLAVSKLSKWLFAKYAINQLFRKVFSLPILAFPFLFTIFALILSFKKFDYIAWIILGVGFLSVGLSHGALDHLTSKKIINNKQLLHFITTYLLKSGLLGLVWLFIPDVALLVFIAYSASHFGQADFEEWGYKQGWQSFLWGFSIIMTILFFHFEELKWILQQIPNLHSVDFLKKMSETQILSIKILVIGSGIFIAALNKSKYILFTLTYLLLSSMLPLIISFGIYFVGQHSMHGWRHLSIGLNERSSGLWLKSLPFSIGGALIILFFLLFAGLNYVGMFFIILSCLSIPHVFSMHRFYSKLKQGVL